MRIKFLVRGEVDEFIIRKILDPLLRGIDRTTHKVAYKTSIGVGVRLHAPGIKYEQV